MTSAHDVLDRHHLCPFRSTPSAMAAAAEVQWRPTLRRWSEANVSIVPHGALMRAIVRLLRRLRRG